MLPTTSLTSCSTISLMTQEQQDAVNQFIIENEALLAENTLLRDQTQSMAVLFQEATAGNLELQQLLLESRHTNEEQVQKLKAAIQVRDEENALFQTENQALKIQQQEKEVLHANELKSAHRLTVELVGLMNLKFAELQAEQKKLENEVYALKARYEGHAHVYTARSCYALRVTEGPNK